MKAVLERQNFGAQVDGLPTGAGLRRRAPTSTQLPTPRYRCCRKRRDPVPVISVSRSASSACPGWKKRLEVCISFRLCSSIARTNCGMTVTKRTHADAAQQVKIAVAVLIQKMDAFAANKTDGSAIVGSDQQLRFRRANVVQVSCHHHLRALWGSRRANIGQHMPPESAGKIRTRCTPPNSASRHAPSFGSMPPLTTAVRVSSGICFNVSQRITSPSAPRTPGTSVRKHQYVGMASHRAGRCHLVRIDVVVFAIEAERERWRAPGWRPSARSPAASADPTHAISPTYPRSGAVRFLRARNTRPSPPESPTAAWPCLPMRCHQLLIDASSQHHQGRISRFCIRDAQARDKFALLSKLLPACASRPLRHHEPRRLDDHRAPGRQSPGYCRAAWTDFPATLRRV